MHIIEYKKGDFMLNNICVLGIDNRMNYVADTFTNKGYTVTRELNINNPAVVILPPPSKKEVIKGKISDIAKSGSVVYGGAIDVELFDDCRKLGIKIYDYLKWDEVTEANAILTAKGIVREAQDEASLNKFSDCLVLGYGFCGRAIARELNGKSRVCVMVRRPEIGDLIISDGFSYIDMRDINKDLSKFQFVFNTVPELVINKKFVHRLSRNVRIFDIASAPGGTDFDYCKENRVFARLSLGIPGKTFPKEAGEIIANAIIKHINSV